MSIMHSQLAISLLIVSIILFVAAIATLVLLRYIYASRTFSPSYHPSVVVEEELRRDRGNRNTKLVSTPVLTIDSGANGDKSFGNRRENEMTQLRRRNLGEMNESFLASWTENGTFHGVSGSPAPSEDVGGELESLRQIVNQKIRKSDSSTVQDSYDAFKPENSFTYLSATVPANTKGGSILSRSERAAVPSRQIRKRFSSGTPLIPKTRPNIVGQTSKRKTIFEKKDILEDVKSTRASRGVKRSEKEENGSTFISTPYKQKLSGKEDDEVAIEIKRAEPKGRTSRGKMRSKNEEEEVEGKRKRMPASLDIVEKYRRIYTDAESAGDVVYKEKARDAGASKSSAFLSNRTSSIRASLAFNEEEYITHNYVNKMAKKVERVKSGGIRSSKAGNKVNFTPPVAPVGTPAGAKVEVGAISSKFGQEGSNKVKTGEPGENTKVGDGRGGPAQEKLPTGTFGAFGNFGKTGNKGTTGVAENTHTIKAQDKESTKGQIAAPFQPGNAGNVPVKPFNQDSGARNLLGSTFVHPAPKSGFEASNGAEISGKADLKKPFALSGGLGAFPAASQPSNTNVNIFGSAASGTEKQKQATPFSSGGQAAAATGATVAATSGFGGAKQMGFPNQNSNQNQNQNFGQNVGGHSQNTWTSQKPNNGPAKPAITPFPSTGSANTINTNPFGSSATGNSEKQFQSAGGFGKMGNEPAGNTASGFGSFGGGQSGNSKVPFTMQGSNAQPAGNSTGGFGSVGNSAKGTGTGFSGQFGGQSGGQGWNGNSTSAQSKMNQGFGNTGNAKIGQNNPFGAPNSAATGNSGSAANPFDVLSKGGQSSGFNAGSAGNSQGLGFQGKTGTSNFNAGSGGFNNMNSNMNGGHNGSQSAPFASGSQSPFGKPAAQHNGANTVGFQTPNFSSTPGFGNQGSHTPISNKNNTGGMQGGVFGTPKAGGTPFQQPFSTPGPSGPSSGGNAMGSQPQFGFGGNNPAMTPITIGGGVKNPFEQMHAGNAPRNPFG